MGKLRVLESFAGYGSQSMSLRDMDIDHEVVGISEIEPDAIIAYGAIRYDINELHTDKTHDEMREELIAKNVGYDFKTGKSKIPRMKKTKLEMLYKFDKAVNNLGDISIIKPQDLPDFDYFTMSFPCQDISVSGKQAGIVKGGTRSGLLYECEKVIETKKPKYILMENVKNLVGKQFRDDFDKWCEYLEGLGYANYHNNYKCLNAKNFQIAQNRERIFMFSVLGEHKEYIFPQGEKLTKRLKDFLEESVDEKYYLSEEIQKRFTPYPKDRLNNDCLEVVGTTSPNPYNDRGELIYDKCTSAWCYNPNKLMSTLAARDYKQPKQIIEIPQATKKGYVELEVPGVADLSFPNSKTRRGRVQECGTVSPTIMANNQELCVFEEIENGAIRGRYNENGKIEQQLELRNDGVDNAITTVNKDNVVLEDIKINRLGGLYDTEDRLREAGAVYGDNPLSPTLNTAQGGYRMPLTIEHQTICEQRCDEGLRFFKDNVWNCPHTIDSGGDKRIIETEPCFRIRKLTPKECLRLMGVSDEDISKMQSVGLSDSALYKLAGNSIVKQVLDALHTNMFKKVERSTPSGE